ncbi:DNA polymerase-like protein [Tanacetum coccineum]
MTISKWKCLKLLLDPNERDLELADPYTQMADIEKMVLPTSQPKKIYPGQEQAVYYRSYSALRRIIRRSRRLSTRVDPQKEEEYVECITAIKKGSMKLKPFIVSDLETIIVNNIYKPYAVGLMLVHPGKMIEKDMIIHTYYSEDYKVILDSFEERSRKVMIDLISKVMLFRFRDSLNLLPGTLQNLAMSLCPDLGTKGSVDHESVNEKSLEKEKRYYNDEIFPIHIHNQNEDTFIRKAYYEGHTDSYKPYGENLYYYDVNSLYHFIMKEYPMPCGVYYSEELKYAVGLGYKVVLISGYLFERKESPFKDFVRPLFLSRLKARKEGNDALSYVYKILMNSLYDRFRINPKSTITEVCNFKRYTDVVSFEGFIHGDMLIENNFIVSYHTNTGNDETHWNSPKNSAIQVAAAITASTGIYMYQFYISRMTAHLSNDTDSVSVFASANIRTLDPALKEARIRAAREHIEVLDGRQQALRAEQQELIVLVIEYEHGGN